MEVPKKQTSAAKMRAKSKLATYGRLRKCPPFEARYRLRYELAPLSENCHYAFEIKENLTHLDRRMISVLLLYPLMDYFVSTNS